MSISPINLINAVPSLKRTSFRATEPQKPDKFIRTTTNIGIRQGYLKKNTTILDKNGAEVPVKIMQDIENSNTFYLGTDDECYCMMKIMDGYGCLSLDRLYNQPANKDFRGAGSEMVKFAVEQSELRGYGGRMMVCMAGSIPFYRKSNFRLGNIEDYDPVPNAMFDFMARTKEPLKMVFTTRAMPIAYLDEEASNALLDGYRLFPKPESKIMYPIALHYEQNGKHSHIYGYIDFCNVDDENYVVQFAKVNDFDQSATQKAYLLMRLNREENKFEILDEGTSKLSYQYAPFQKQYEKDISAQLWLSAKERADELGIALEI